MGIVGGMLTGLVSGLLQLMTGDMSYAIQAGLIIRSIHASWSGSYYTWMAVKQKAKGNKGSMVAAIVVGTVIGGLLRYLIHFIGGIVFFASYAPEGQPVWLYSLVYNASYMIPSIILSAIVAAILLHQHRVFRNDIKNRRFFQLGGTAIFYLMVVS